MPAVSGAVWGWGNTDAPLRSAPPPLGAFPTHPPWDSPEPPLGVYLR